MIEQLLTILLPIVTCTSLGFFWRRRVEGIDTHALVFLVSNVGFPCLLISSLDRPGLSLGVVANVFMATAMALGCFALVGIAALSLMNLPIRRYLPSLMLPNSGNMGIPISFLAFGDGAVVYAVAFSTLVQVGHATLGVWFASGHMNPRAIIRNPMIHALLIAMALLAFQIELPVPVQNVVKLLGGITVPLMLVLLGISLATLTLDRLLQPIVLSIIRVWGGFGIGLLLAKALGMGAIAAGTFAIQCGMPTAVLTYLLAQRYGGPAQEVAGMVMITTALVLVSIPLFLWTLGQ